MRHIRIQAALNEGRFVPMNSIYVTKGGYTEINLSTPTNFPAPDIANWIDPLRQLHLLGGRR